MSHHGLGPPESALEEEKVGPIGGKYLSDTADSWSVLQLFMALYRWWSFTWCLRVDHIANISLVLETNSD